jgi:hypothetical protein
LVEATDAIFDAAAGGEHDDLRGRSGIERVSRAGGHPTTHIEPIPVREIQIETDEVV